MRLFMLVVVLSLLGSQAWADENLKVLCQGLTLKKETIQSADYVPDVDVRGNDVVSANVDGSEDHQKLIEQAIPKTLTVKLDEIDSAEYLGDQENLALDSNLLEIHMEDGKVFLADQEVGDVSDLETLCSNVSVEE